MLFVPRYLTTIETINASTSPWWQRIPISTVHVPCARRARQFPIAEIYPATRNAGMALAASSRAPPVALWVLVMMTSAQKFPLLVTCSFPNEADRCSLAFQANLAAFTVGKDHQGCWRSCVLAACSVTSAVCCEFNHVFFGPRTRCFIMDKLDNR